MIRRLLLIAAFAAVALAATGLAHDLFEGAAQLLAAVELDSAEPPLDQLTLPARPSPGLAGSPAFSRTV